MKYIKINMNPIISCDVFTGDLLKEIVDPKGVESYHNRSL